MTVSLRDVVMAVGYGDASLVGESAGYLILGAADCAARSLERATLDSIAISDEGAVKLEGEQVPEDDAERALRDLLGQLLKRVRTSCPNLDRVARRAELRGLHGLVNELEAALVPVNRKAARRTLARLCREAKKSSARERTFAEVEPVPVQEPVYVPAAPSPEPPVVQDPVPVPAAPSPQPLPVHELVRGEYAAQIVAQSRRRPSQLPTVRAPLPARNALASLADTFGAQTPLESAPVHWAPHSLDAVDPSGFVEPDVFLDEDDFDDAPTQVFLGVAPVDGQATAVQRQIASPPPRRRSPAVAPRRARQLSDDESLIPMSASAPHRRPSDIDELLDKMSIAPLATDELYVGLKTLSRIDLSPAAPPVGASWIDDERRK